MHSVKIVLCLLCILPVFGQIPKNLVVSPKTRAPPITEINVVLLFDVSGSIYEDSLDRAKQACELLLARQFDSTFDVKFGVVSFSDEPTILHNMSSDRVNITKTILEIRRTNGRTRYGDALTGTLQLLSSPCALKTVFLISDGDQKQEPQGLFEALWGLKKSDSVRSSLYELIQKEITVMGFSIASTFPAGGFVGNTIKYQNISKTVEDATVVLRGAVESVLLAAKTKNELVAPFIQVDYIQQPYYSSIGEQVQLQLRITNKGKEDVPKGTTITFVQNSYFRQEVATVSKVLRTGSVATISIRLTPFFGKTISDLPVNGFVSILFLGPTGAPVDSDIDGFFLATELLIGKLIEYQPADREIPAVNIMLFGPKGSGKSSLINSMLTAISAEVQAYVPVGGVANGTCTKEITRTPLWNSNYFPNIKANLWDSWGITGTDFTVDFFKKIMVGHIPSGYTLSDWQNGVEKRGTGNETSTREKEIHAVLFVITPEGVRQNSNIAIISALNEHAQDFGLSPLFVITHIDTFFTKHDIQSFEQQVAKDLQVPNNRVFLLHNYAAQKNKTFEVDKLSLEVLIRAVGAADTHLKRKVLQETTCDPHCRHTGICVLNKCDCRRTGHTGISCETPLCQEPCENGGICLGFDVCECPVGVFGPRCEIGNKEIFKIGIILFSLFVAVIASWLIRCIASRTVQRIEVSFDLDEFENEVNKSSSNIDDIDDAEGVAMESLPTDDNEGHDTDDEIARIKASFKKNSNKNNNNNDNKKRTSNNNNDNNNTNNNTYNSYKDELTPHITPLQELRDMGLYTTPQKDTTKTPNDVIDELETPNESLTSDTAAEEQLPTIAEGTREHEHKYIIEYPAEYSDSQSEDEETPLIGRDGTDTEPVDGEEIHNNSFVFEPIHSTDVTVDTMRNQYVIVNSNAASTEEQNGSASNSLPLFSENAFMSDEINPSARLVMSDDVSPPHVVVLEDTEILSPSTIVDTANNLPLFLENEFMSDDKSSSPILVVPDDVSEHANGSERDDVIKESKLEEVSLPLSDMKEDVKPPTEDTLSVDAANDNVEAASAPTLSPPTTSSIYDSGIKVEHADISTHSDDENTTTVTKTEESYSSGGSFNDEVNDESLLHITDSDDEENER